MMALMIRWTLAFPGEPFPIIGQFLFPHTNGVVPPDTYAMLFYSAWNDHDFLRNYSAIDWRLRKLLYSAYDWCSRHGFPTLNMLSFWLAFVSAILLLASLFTPLGGAAGGWVSYPTLSTLIGSPGVGQNALVFSSFRPWCFFNLWEQLIILQP